MPQPKAGEVLIKVAASGVNRPDVFQRKGGYAPPPGASDLPGLEVAGEIVERRRSIDEAQSVRSEDGRSRVRVAGGRRLRGIRGRAARAMPAGAAGLVGCRGGFAAGDVLHGLEQRVRPRAARRGRRRRERNAAGAGRLERHRRDGDPDRACARFSRVRDGRLGRKVPRVRSAGRRAGDQLQDGRFRRSHQVADERSRRRRDPRHGGGQLSCRAN